MKFTTLCYIENDGRYLMLHRTAKEKDPSHGKWIGVGGKFEYGESPEECLIREVKEETGFTLISHKFKGMVTFISNEWEAEYMHIFTADGFMVNFQNESTVYDSSVRYNGALPECSEGELAWIEKDNIKDLRLWQGDRVFLQLLLTSDEFFSLKLVYEGDNLIEVYLNGKKLKDDIPYL